MNDTLRIFVWDNDTEGFNTRVLGDFGGLEVSGHHSGGFVVIAETLEDAIGLIRSHPSFGNLSSDGEAYLRRTVVESAIEQGLVYYGDGDC